ncbi:MAG: hypothetical protein HN595_08090, partial [Flavobacteriaceae bacterium]|nr:hypothetical protein [Flavobacteriaceae bacterium]
MRLRRLNSTLILLFLSFLVKGQVSGHIYSSVTKQPLPFCNIVCKSTNIGTITDLGGGFEINTTLGSTLDISFIGYKSKKIIVNNTNIGSVYLDLQSNMIAEVRVLRKEDPAVALMKKVIKRKQLLRPQGNIKGMEVQVLSKVYLSDPNNKFIGLKKSKLFGKMSDRMIDGVPFFISEKRLLNDSLLSQQDYGVGIENIFFVN